MATTVQGELFANPAPSAPAGRRSRTTPPPREPAPTWDGPRPWDPVDEADRQLGWAYPYVTPARAREIARDIRDQRPRCAR